MAENFANNFHTTLNGAIDDSVTTIVVTSATGAPDVNFRLLIDSEYMLVTAKAGTSWTVTRGIEGSTAAAHGDGARVSAIVTAGGLVAAFAPNIPSIPGISIGGGAPSNGQTTTLATNSAYYRRTLVPFSITPTLIGCFIKISSGNLDLGVYADDGTGNAPGARIASLGSTASPGTGTRVFSLSPGTISPGIVWLGIAADNSTLSVGYEGEGVLSTGLGGGGSLMGLVQTTAFPLPNPAGTVSPAVSFAPLIWLEIA